MKKSMIRGVVLSLLFVTGTLRLFGVEAKAASMAAGSVPDAWMVLSMKELTARAHAFVKSNKIDSAMYVFAIAGNKYQQGMSDDEKRMAVHALNNAGALCSACSSDYSVSYRYLQRALELAEQNGYHDMLLDIEMHLANLYSLFDDQGTESKELLRKCYHASLSGKNWNIMTLAFVNLYVIGYDGDVSEFEGIVKSEIPKDVAMADYARHLYRGVKAVRDSRYGTAREEFREMHRNIGNTLGIQRSACLMNKLIAGSFMAEGAYDSAAVYYDRLRAVADSADIQPDVIKAYRELTVCYQKMGNERMAEKMHIMYLERKDSVNSANSLNSLNNLRRKSEIDKVERRMEDMARNKRRQEYLMASVAVIAVIVIVFLIIQYAKNKRLRALNRFLYNKTQEMMKEVQTRKPDTVMQEKKPGRGLSETKKDEIHKQVEAVLADTDAICSPDFTLNRLAQQIGSNTVYVSQVVNECYAVSFSVLLSNRRIREAIRKLNDKDTYGNLTIEAISQSVGFRSRASFIKSFKSVTGLTPSEYLREARSRAE